MRHCLVCGKPMTQGYVVDDGLEYYCSDECLHKRYSDEEYQKMHENDVAYWTEWEDEEDGVVVFPEMTKAKIYWEDQT